jgi:hypothetical protein
LPACCLKSKKGVVLLAVVIGSCLLFSLSYQAPKLNIFPMLNVFQQIHKFFSSFRIFLLCQIHSGSSEVKGEKKVLDFNEPNDGRESSVIIERDEVKMVMEKMGFFGSSVKEKLVEK